MQNDAELQRLFKKLHRLWATDRKVILCASHKAMIKHPAYQMIIALGPRMVPIILKEWQEHYQSGWWSPALTAITGAQPILKEHAGKYGDIREDWLKWGKEHGYL
jgi:hypothetical protein